jgi:hypothetical protein
METSLLWILIIVAVFFGILGLMVLYYSKKRSAIEKQPQNIEMKATKEKQLNDLLSTYPIDRQYEIRQRNFVDPVVYVGVSMSTQMLIIYKPIKYSTDEVLFDKIPFSNIRACDFIEDNETKKPNTLANAIVGGIVGGGIGAVVGATTHGSVGISRSIKIRLVLKDILNPHYEIVVLEKELERKSTEYKNLHTVAEEIYSACMSIIENN